MELGAELLSLARRLLLLRMSTESRELTETSPFSPSLQAVFHMQSVKCLKCQEQTRAVLPCQHAVLCELCAEGSECPVCQPSRAHALQS